MFCNSAAWKWPGARVISFTLKEKHIRDLEQGTTIYIRAYDTAKGDSAKDCKALREAKESGNFKN